MAQLTAKATSGIAKDVREFLLAADRSKFECANGQFELLGNANVACPAANCERFPNVVKAYNDGW